MVLEVPTQEPTPREEPGYHNPYEHDRRGNDDAGRRATYGAAQSWLSRQSTRHHPRTRQREQRVYDLSGAGSLRDERGGSATERCGAPLLVVQERVDGDRASERVREFVDEIERIRCSRCEVDECHVWATRRRGTPGLVGRRNGCADPEAGRLLHEVSDAFDDDRMVVYDQNAGRVTGRLERLIH